jgi:hypothetical protein
MMTQNQVASVINYTPKFKVGDIITPLKGRDILNILPSQAMKFARLLLLVG